MATTTPPDFLSVREAADVLRIGKSRACDLANDRGEKVRNRATWTIDTIHDRGSITAAGLRR